MNQDVESKHNLYTQSSPNPHADVEYARDHALLIAKAMVDFITKVQQTHGHLDSNIYYKKD